MKRRQHARVRRNRIIFVVFVVLVCFFVHKFFFSSQEIRVVSKIEDYSYQLESNQTKIFRKYYRELDKELKDNRVDEENYAKLVSKLFIIDFYTLSNKVTNQDIGGVQFLHTSIQENFKNKATDTIYKYVKSNIYGNRRQQLPTVRDVDILDFKTISYDYHDTTEKNAYEVKVKIRYKKDLGYDQEKTLVLVHEEQKIVVVEIR